MRVRAHNSDTSTNLHTNHNHNYNNNNILVRTTTDKTNRSGLAFHYNLKHGLRCCTCRSCFHNSSGVLETIAQGVRIEGGLCEFARARQQRQQHL
jgi:hypothetical protein